MDRWDRLDAAIVAMAGDSQYTPVVTGLGCLRGVSTLTAFALPVLLAAPRGLDLDAGLHGRHSKDPRNGAIR